MEIELLTRRFLNKLSNRMKIRDYGPLEIVILKDFNRIRHSVSKSLYQFLHDYLYGESLSYNEIGRELNLMKFERMALEAEVYELREKLNQVMEEY